MRALLGDRCLTELLHLCSDVPLSLGKVYFLINCLSDFIDLPYLTMHTASSAILSPSEVLMHLDREYPVSVTEIEQTRHLSTCRSAGVHGLVAKSSRSRNRVATKQPGCYLAVQLWKSKEGSLGSSALDFPDRTNRPFWHRAYFWRELQRDCAAKR